MAVSNPEIHDDGFFSAKYVSYKVKTPTLGYEIRRKDKDFNILHELLCKIYPHILIPGIPELKKASKLDMKALEKRAAHLESFINKILQSEELKSCPVLLEFLKDTDLKGFTKQLKTAFEKSARPMNINEIQATSGYQKIDANKHIIEFSDKLPVYLNVYESYNTKMHHLTRKLTDQFKDLSLTLNEIAD